LIASRRNRCVAFCIAGLVTALAGLGAGWPGRTAVAGTDAPKGGIRAFTRTIELVDHAAAATAPFNESEEADNVAETIWLSSGSRNWAANSNWTNDKPGAAKTAVLDGRSSVPIAGSDQSGGGTVPRLRIHREQEADIGDAGTPLILPVTAIDHRGRCSLYIQNSLAAGTIISLDSPVIGETALGLTGKNPLYLNIMRGIVTYNPTSDTTGGTYIGMTGGELMIISGAVLVTRLFQNGGIVTCYGEVTEVVLSGNATFTTEGSGCIDKLRMFGGTFTASGLPSTSLIEIFGGIVDYRDVSNLGYTPLVIIYPGGDFWASAETTALCTIRDLRNEFP